MAGLKGKMYARSGLSKAKKMTKQQQEVADLKAQLPLAKPTKRKTLQQKTAQQLIPEADKYWSRYIRLRDSEWTGREWVSKCICCDRKLVVIGEDGRWKQGTDCGHFISRGVMSLRFDEYNTNAQSSFCNAWKDKETMLEGYRNGLSLKYGEDTVKELKRLSKALDAYKRPSKQELLDIIESSKNYIDYTLEHKENYGTNNRNTV